MIVLFNPMIVLFNPMIEKHQVKCEIWAGQIFNLATTVTLAVARLCKVNIVNIPCILLVFLMIPYLHFSVAILNIFAICNYTAEQHW